MPLSNADLPYLYELNNLTGIASQQNTARDDRTQVGTFSTFGSLTEYDISDGKVPLLGSKYVPFKAIAHELIWMLRGDRSLKYMAENDVHIWDSWLVPGSEVRNEEGKLIDGIVSALYPIAWRKWEFINRYTKEEANARLERSKTEVYGPRVTTVSYQSDGDCYVHEVVDQISDAIHLLKTNPTSRRILVSAWDPTRNHDAKLPACHPFFQFYVEADGTLTAMFYMRSSDHFLGKPFNLVQYAILTHLIAHLSGLKAGRLLSIVGDQHLYSNHVDVANQQLSGAIDIQGTAPDGQNPYITINEALTSIDDLTIDDLTLHGYIPGPKYTGKVAV